ncbi:MAG: hypothetical protein NTZ05_16910 [Chloroflexi bacterium]|nr:hypothetical protein [Chloroflexota bacterium]
MRRNRPFAVPFLAAVLAAAACGTPAMPAAPAAAPATSPASSAPAAAGTAAPVAAAVPAAPANTSGRKEVTLVTGPRKRLEETIAALQKGDIASAKTAFETYNADWNGVEVYVNFRSRALYGEIETHYEVDIAKALEAAKPDPAAIIPQLREMIGQYDQAIKLSDTGPAISPIFEDVAVVRIVRAPLRTVSPALKAGNVEKAKVGFAAFKAHWSEAVPYFKARSSEAYQETDAALTKADTAMSVAVVNAAEAGPLVDALMERFNYGVNLVNAAARNADTSKTAFADQDVKSAAAIGGIQRQLKASLTAWEKGDFTAAGDAARNAAGPRFDSVSALLQAKTGADAPLKKALDAYVALAGQAGDAAKVRAANKTAIEAAAIAQQAAEGQFWTDAKFQEAYQKAVSAA